MDTAVKEEKKSDDLFDQFNSLFAGRKLDRPPAPFILHRFLACDADFCQVAKELQKDVTDPQMVYEIWRAAVPRSPRAPRLKYTGPRRSKAAEGLLECLMRRHAINRFAAGEMLDIIKGAGRIQQACTEYGIEYKAEDWK